MTEYKKLSVDLTDRSVTALDAAVDQSGDTTTDTVNRSIQIYAAIIQLHNEGAGSGAMLLIDMPGGTCRIEVNRPWWRWW